MILLTGASGFLGQHVLQKIEQRGLPYMATSRSGRVGVACDLRSEREVYQLIERVTPRVLIHCAAIVPKEEFSPIYDSRVAANASIEMFANIVSECACKYVLASSQTAEHPAQSEYANGKYLAERELLDLRDPGDVILRLPGLFGLPRCSGVIYEACKSGSIPASFGPYPAMHVQDAAEYLVRAATMPSDGKPEPFNVVYGDPRLEATYGSLGVTFQDRVKQFVEELKREQVNA